MPRITPKAITADYHLSERALAPSVAWAEANDRELAAELASLPPWALHAPMPVMEAFLGILRERHGSIVGYLTDAGVERGVIDELRSRLLTV